MGWKVIVSPSALADLEDIVRYIARHNPDAAARMGHALIARAASLALFPEMGRVVPEFHRPDLREVIHRSYRVIYRVRREQEAVEIVRFWHGARGFPHIPTRTEP
ncbi:MAG: type II toxin-antitoxin system RelE/ParE family toxin [Verrucomicrobia bacterium]|jgi:plasmid stabilization system protein ParE|nr:type II toxin-antitoxin system RelE/ParE family toxin [Verrucomicrobiota bacterium]